MNYASMLKSNSIRLAILVELRLVTDRQTYSRLSRLCTPHQYTQHSDRQADHGITSVMCTNRPGRECHLYRVAGNTV